MYIILARKLLFYSFFSPRVSGISRKKKEEINSLIHKMYVNIRIYVYTDDISGSSIFFFRLQRVYTLFVSENSKLRPIFDSTRKRDSAEISADKTNSNTRAIANYSLPRFSELKHTLSVCPRNYRVTVAVISTKHCTQHYNSPPPTTQ